MRTFIMNDALSIARGIVEEPEAVVELAHHLMDVYLLGERNGQALESKQAYWLGVKAGVARNAWVMNGVKYVGCAPCPAATLSAELARIEEEEKEALNA